MRRCSPKRPASSTDRFAGHTKKGRGSDPPAFLFVGSRGAGPAAGALAKRGFQKPNGEWNVQEVTVKGSRLKVELNGTVILDADLAQVDMKTVMANKAHPGATRTAGFFGLAGHTDPVAFKDMFIRRLDNK